MQVITKPDSIKPQLENLDRRRTRVGWVTLGLGCLVVGAALLWSWGWQYDFLVMMMLWCLLLWTEARSEARGMRRVLHSACPLLHTSCCAPWDMASCSVRSNRRWAAAIARVPTAAPGSMPPPDFDD